ncbi:DUF2946 family protein [Billgrantia antri]|uniref:DUF2946 domain-containing protein n=1 Tax=Billgrantia antri TaxID=2846777 RepID=A0ABS6ZL38_9GAMM|nr:DUF2946 family protein [Halomonas antri]MBW6389720.1 DUF2946 domain-containing protein [Halomonas antri]
MHRFATRWHSLTACLGLLALTLALGGPLLSQIQRLMEAAPAESGTSLHGAHAGHHHSHPSTTSGTEHTGTSQHALHAHHEESHGRQVALEACDYCTLFLHMPGLPVGDILALPRVPPSSRSLTATTHRFADEERYRHYEGRAPPLRSCG